MLRTRLIRWITVLSIASLLAPAESAAREPAPEKRVYNTRHIVSQPPDIDGKGDDPAWDDVEWSGDFTQLDPDDGGEPSQQTAFKILFDDHNLYVLIRAYDTKPDRITSRVTRRDDWDNDWVEIHFDSYHDKRTAFSFTLTASGGRGDEAISNDGNDWDASWDPVWFGASTIDEEGWLAEMRIPLSQLRFSGEEGQVWGLQVQRRLYRREERSGWQHIHRNSPGWVSLFGELRGLEGIESSHRIEVLPYVVGDLNRFQAEGVVGRVTIPLPEEANDHVAAVPQRCAQVHLLAGVLARNRWLGRDVATSQAEAGRIGPVLEVVGGAGDQLARSHGVSPTLAGQVVATIHLGTARHLQPASHRIVG